MDHVTVITVLNTVLITLIVILIGSNMYLYFIYQALKEFSIEKLAELEVKLNLLK